MHEFSPPPKTYSGRGSVDTLSAVGDRRSVERPVVVTDEGVAAAGIAATVADTLPGDPPVVDAVTPNPAFETVEHIAEALAEYEADLVVGVGGGSVMDAAKAACALPAFGDDLTELRAADPTQPRSREGRPLVLVPTTAGTGTETGHWAVLSDHEADEKVSVGHPVLRADATVLDPALTDDCPSYVTASSGFDVLTHAVESLVATGASPLTTPYSRRAFALAERALPRAVRGDDPAARDDMLHASYLAGLAMNNAGLGAVHGLSHAIGGVYDTPHGHTNAKLLPAVVRRSARDPAARSAFATLAPEAREPGAALASHLEALRSQVGLDDPLPNAPERWEWDAVVERAAGNVNTETSPVSFSKEELRDVCLENL
ncbi:iron-containing alcohol dehydrogenase family protein [Haloarchaeobius sp. HME9146]|uniref:iron-containing alcohol dehydrogenase family protein n=1 Tax=Haloarchaeobius sp. HME9146 TaxID=2978732 RepID=UPI0021C0CB9D|nr:iron-containing alcohol dehydrogenase [Haloarchaeobius sp. HME9146]MCT9095583.1 iron-containing alcohol dehydrogenase [Haloarchaeobius sp. HME9146]